ncbi:MAG: cobalamin-independent methionine synthase II family protein [Chloroflexi bacterium]|nr:cobalamin-independent methionine synthase II family protein [Chloroflexota bacterium]MBV9600463.1 cobalamin-independent methionine synthase II family protein [Chloroflexota bacterium]
MKRSERRILTTHAGSLPRPPEILKLVEGRDQREVMAQPGAAERIASAVSAVVDRQLKTGIDVPSDGEMGRTGFAAYATERLTGFDGERRPMQGQVERSMFPEFYAEAAAGPGGGFGFPTCNGPITWRGPEFIQRDIASFQAALASSSATEAFMPAVSPGQIWLNFQNEYYPSDREYVLAAARALGNEYRAIVDAGFLLQIDDPGLAMGWNRGQFADKSLDDYRVVVKEHVEAINLALEGIPEDRVRLHVCWGNGEWPHVRDVPLEAIVDLLYAAHAGAIYVEGANPRHGHEWKVFEAHPLREGMLLIPGVIDTVTNFVEHPDLVAERIARYAGVVGKQNVIAGTDCGFGTSARSRPRVHPTIAWAKLESLAEGARRASAALW